VFFDTYDAAPGQSSFVYQLAFNLDGPLGGTATSIGLSNIYFTTDGNASGTYLCGGPARLPTAGVTCTTALLTGERIAGSGFGPAALPHVPNGLCSSGRAEGYSLCAAAISDLQLAVNLFMSRPDLTQSFIS
jgi:hypothetical protein